MPNLQSLAMLSAVIAFASCEQHKQVKIEESGTEVVKVRTPQEDTINKVAEPEAQTATVKGKVLEVRPGKDGYTAKIETSAKEIYFVTVSHSNLKDHSQYKSVAVGDEISVTGDSWKLEDENQITVRELR
ncbi:hypothetical protein [Flavobacterium sp.]|uniref:hypothetical protein n=1 Tax=Flavobacterium sp. TaxID=239 RepID=UPI0025BC4896|nr:hypothetical protein [Flavobacterium sp.]